MVKNNYKLIIAFILVALISGTSVYAATTIIKSKDVSYDKTTSGGKYDNVQDAIDELYEKSGLLKDIWTDKTLNGADPVLDVDGATKKLIPITIDNDGTVHYANLKTKWYDYADKKWANAVILVDNPKNGSKENYTYKTGDIINENDIESYFVWIPRYSYKIWNMGNYTGINKISTALTDKNYATSPQNAFNKPRIIDIKFGDDKTNPKMAESAAKIGEYYTHPAFTLGDKDLNGIWVGKFETGYNQDGVNGSPFTIDSSWTNEGAIQDKEASNRIIIKPNVYSWRGGTVKDFFLSSYNYNRTLESHMMKNTEWGAMAYLSHSAYGIAGALNVNNNNEYKTGYGASVGTNQETIPATSGNSSSGLTQEYNTIAGYLASTTGNITGIYDMAGSAWECMASYVSGHVGASELDLAELTTTYKNYVDVYSSESSGTTYNKRILGDATGEMGPFYEYYDGDGTNGQNSTIGTSRYHGSWYTDLAYFVGSGLPWFSRGGSFNDGGIAGQFYFGWSGGEAVDSYGFRLVLATK